MIGVIESSLFARDGGRWACWLLALVFLAAAACDRTETTDPEAEAMSPDQKRGAAARPEAPTTLEGLLVVDLMPSHGKTTQGTWLHTGDGKVLLDYRPVERFRPYHERRVEVRGEFYEPKGQALMVDHFRVADLELVGDRAPRELDDGALPDPTFVESADDLEAIDGRLLEAVKYVTAYGKLEDIGDDTPLTDGLLRLDDGTTVELGRIDPDISAASPGKRTVGGVLSRTDDGWRLAVRAWAICEGRAPRCGVEAP